MPPSCLISIRYCGRPATAGELDVLNHTTRIIAAASCPVRNAEPSRWKLHSCSQDHTFALAPDTTPNATEKLDSKVSNKVNTLPGTDAVAIAHL